MRSMDARKLEQCQLVSESILSRPKAYYVEIAGSDTEWTKASRTTPA